MFVISARDKILGSFVVQNCAALLETGIEKRPITGYLYFQYHEMYAASSLRAQTFLSIRETRKCYKQWYAIAEYPRVCIFQEISLLKVATLCARNL